MRQDKLKNKNKKNKQPWPLIILVTGGLLLVIGAFFAFSRPGKPSAAIEVKDSPRLKVDREKVDLGEVKLGQPVQVTFDLTNVGDQPLEFKEAPTVEVKEGC